MLQGSYSYVASFDWPQLSMNAEILDKHTMETLLKDTSP